MTFTFMTSLFLLFFISGLTSQKVSAYQIFNGKGKKVQFEEMISNIIETEVLLFGEIHNDPIIHWLQYESLLAIGKKRKLVLGAEMFEADNQQGLNQYLLDEISKDSMAKVVRLWNNYDTDYKKLVEFAKEKKIPFIATNVPRKYANKVFKNGFEVLDTLPNDEKAWIAPLPIKYDGELECYKSMMEMDMGGHSPTENFPKAQAIKDATMTHFILKNRLPNTMFIHFNGTYHSDNYQSIFWYLKEGKEEIKCKTISAIQQKQVSKLDKEHLGKADFIICVDEDMTTTY
ncbi:MAG: ChaN family lipoprotein [Saprospiraceae bacterium]